VSRVALGVWLAALISHAGVAHAHDRSTSSSTITRTDDGAMVELELRAIDLTVLESAGVEGAIAALHGELSPTLGAYLVTRLVLESAGSDCTPSTRAVLRRRSAESLAFGWSVRCEGDADFVRSALLDERPGHVHFARIEGESPIDARVLGGGEPRAPLDRATAGGWADYVGLGARHVLGGLDHLAFLLLALVVASRARDLALAVSGFTVGHALALSLVAFGFLLPKRALVEVLVALSIAFVAVDDAFVTNGRRDRMIPMLFVAALALAAVVGAMGAPLLFGGLALASAAYFARSGEGTASRPVVASLFGLVHGLAFAEVLSDIGDDRLDLIPALAGFNAGVELGQLAVVIPAWWLLQRAIAPRHRPRIVMLGAAAGFGLAVFLLASG
jgi:hypothetical protein